MYLTAKIQIQRLDIGGQTLEIRYQKLEIRGQKFDHSDGSDSSDGSDALRHPSKPSTPHPRGNQKYLGGKRKSSTEQMKNSSEVLFHSSEVLFHGSLENFHLLAGDFRFPRQELKIRCLQSDLSGDWRYRQFAQLKILLYICRSKTPIGDFATCSQHIDMQHGTDPQPHCLIRKLFKFNRLFRDHSTYLMTGLDMLLVSM